MGEAEAATKELGEYLASRMGGKPGDLVSRIGGFLSGTVAEPDLLSAAAHTDPKTEAAQMCLACFYAGSKRLIAGDKAKAREYFERVIATKATDYLEYSSAAAELKALASEK
jgi:lipoprotein NlpI